MSLNSLVIEKSISAPIEQVYRAFTNSTAYREWMCDTCLADPKPMGRLYFGWNGPFYAAGEFTALESDRSVAFTWLGRGEPGPSWIKVTLSKEAASTHLRLEHGGLGDGEAWERARNLFQMSWESGLENLVSVLETGRDLRIVNRPMLGVLIDQFNPEIAQRLGVPVTQGVRLSGVAEGMGAQAAGLQADDVLVRLGKTELRDYGDLGSALQSAKAGDEIEVAFYRGAEKKQASFKLSGRRIPEIPETALELSASVEQLYAEIMPTLDQLFQGVSEAQASYRPAEVEWSAQEVLAHLIHSERGIHNALAEAISSAEAIYDNYAENWPGRNRATLSAFPTLQALLNEYKLLMAETIAIFAAIPPEFIARKSSYWRLVYTSAHLASHFNGHAGQIQAALEAARTQGL